MTKIYRRSVVTCVLALLSIYSFSQAVEKKIQHREQVWIGYFNQSRLSNRWGFWLDVHYRQTDNFIDRPFQLLIRPAITYYIKDNLRVNVGYTFANHFPGKSLETSRTEHRPWQQIVWNQNLNAISTRQWLRLEERYVRRVVDDEPLDDYTFNYRIRYSLTFQIPLKGKEIVAGTPFVSVVDEVFINFGNQILYNTFDQNRFFAGGGYQLTDQFAIQLGYLNIFQQESTGNRYISSNAIRLYFIHNLDFRSGE